VQERREFSEFPQVDVEPKPLLRLGVLHVEPKPLLRLKEVLPGSEYEGKPLLIPPLCEHVPRPEFEL
jgi:hypothetical protein